jgi:transcriptional regulator
MTKKGEKKAKAEKAANTNKGPKQGTLPAEGMARKRIAEIDKAAEAYRVERNKRQAQTKVEKAKKQELIQIARKHGIKVYVYEGEDGEELEVEYTEATTENVKVTQVAKAGADEDNA